MAVAYIVDVVRTAGGHRNGAPEKWHPPDLGGEVLNAVLDRSGIDPASIDDVIVGWGAIRGDVLEGLYTAPEYAGQGVGAGLLDRLEALMRGRGVDAVCAEASSNAKAFYLRRGYRETGPQTPVGAWPIAKQLLT